MATTQPLTNTYDGMQFTAVGSYDSHETSQRKWVYGATSGAAAIAILACRVFVEFSYPAKALLMAGFGVASHFSIQQMPKIINVENYFLRYYVGRTFLTLTQFNLNNRASEKPTGQSIIDGICFAMFGLAVGRVIQLATDTKLAQDYTTQIAHASHYEEMQDGSSRPIQLIAGNTPFQRRIKECTALIFSSALLLYGYWLPKWHILIRFGWLLVGRSLGSLAFEGVHSYRLSLEKRLDELLGTDEDYGTVTSRVKFMRKLEHIVNMSAVAWPALFVAFNRSESDVIAGACLGISRQIKLIRITTTKPERLIELKTEQAETKNLNLAGKVARFIEKHWWDVAVLSFTTWQGAVGDKTDKIVMWTSGAVYVFARALGEIVNRKTVDGKGDSILDQNTSRVLATLFFYFLYANGIPLFFPIIEGWIDTGDRALSYYSTLIPKLLTALSWSSLTFGLGMQEVQKRSSRTSIENHYDAIGVLLTAIYFFDSFLPMFGIHPQGE